MRHPRSTRVLVGISVAAAALVAASLQATAFARAATAESHAVASNLGRLVGGKSASALAPRAPQIQNAPVAVSHLPAAGSFALALVAGRSTVAAGDWRVVGSSGIAVVNTTKAGSAQVKVDVLDAASTRALGLSGLVLRLSRSTGAAAAPLAVKLPTGLLTGLYGADYTTRVRWVQLPATVTKSALSSGAVRPAALPSSRTSGATTVTQNVSARPMLLAASSAPVSSGGAGDWSASSLKPAGSWSVSMQGGDFTWSYPLQVPPAAAGPAPSVSLSYDSGAVDGETASTNNQSSVIGDGWQLGGTGFIERSYLACSKDGTGLTGDQATSTDLCWNGQQDSVSFEGHSGVLVPTGTANQYRIQGDDGSRVQYLPTSTTCADGGHDNGCWQLTTQDGTQYFFGRTTNSAWTVPVYGDDSSDECHSSTFAASVCTQDWRWNLDYVVDVHGNSETMSYGSETNYYHHDGGALMQYVRGGYLREIDYGIAPGSTTATDRVTFGYDANGRCSSTGTNCALQANGAAATPANYPDVPWDQYCASTDACNGLTAPTFFTNELLDSVTTQAVVAGSWTTADAWTFDHSFVNPGDTSAASLWLSTIHHPGLSDTTFTPISLANRVKFDQFLPLQKQRIGDVNLDSGAIIAVSYDTPDCTPTLVATLNPASNTHQCFPQWWTPPGGSPLLDWFNKYRVHIVTANPETGGSHNDPTTTQYLYTSNPAWRLETSPSTLDSQRTWSTFAGYKTVEVRNGDPESAQVERVDYTYFQGMDHDPDGTASSSYRSATLTGGGHTVTDSLWWAGRLFETAVHNGNNVISDTVTVPWAAASAASSRTVSFPNPAGSGTFSATLDRGAYLTGDSVSYASSVLSTSPGTLSLRTTTTTAHDSYGRPTSVETATADAGTTCTTTRYVTDGTGHTDTALWLLDLVAETRSVGVACAATPTYPDDAIADTRMYYDGATGTLSQPLSKGDLTRTEVVKSYSGTTPVFLTTSSSPTAAASPPGYDAMGRQLRVTNVEQHTTTTAYTPATGGPLTATTVTVASDTALALATTKQFNPLWGAPISVKDANANLTTATYDSLGRLTAVWLPDRPLTTDKTAHTGTASAAYSYIQSSTQPLETTTTALNANGRTTSRYAFADGLGRPIQTQVPMDSENPATGAHIIGGTVLTDAFYDQAGHIRLTNNTFATTDVMPSSTLFNPAASTQIPSQTQTTWDGAGRKSADITLGLRSDQTFGELWRTSYAYPGADRTDTTPPAGGTPTSTWTDSLGRTRYLDQYLSATPTGTKQRTSYTYYPAGELKSMTDQAANQWSWTYDVRGRQVGAADPDTGTTTTDYDDAGNITDTTDGGGNKLRFAYDALDRKTTQSEYQTTPTVGYAQVAAWSYDTATLGKGLLASSSSYVGSTAAAFGKAYTKNVSSYNALGKPLSTSTVIPNWNGATTNTTFSSTLGYNQAGNLASWTDPAAGGLPLERPGYVYDDFGNVTQVGGTVSYVADVQFNHINLPVFMDFSNGSTEIDRHLNYDDATNRLTSLSEVTNAATGFHLASHSYTYTNSGLLTSDSNTADGQGTDTQCYRYDQLQELTDVWTPASNTCASAPTTATALGGPAPYWQSYQYDTNTGNRTLQVKHTTTAGGTDSRVAYTYDPTHSHELTGKASATAPQGTPPTGTGWTAGSSAAYGYNADGQTTSRSNQTLTWNAEGRLTGVAVGSASVSNVYDADGNLLLQTDSTAGTTLFLGDTELHIATGSTTVTATRTYTINGMPIAERSTTAAAPTTSKLYWLDASALGQNTAGDEVDATTLATTHRYLDPFGNTRGTTPAWTSTHGFLNQPTQPTTATVHLGARDYDPVLGRFLSVDSVLDPSNPAQNNGYSYGWNDPVANPDPSGLRPEDESGRGIKGNDLHDWEGTENQATHLAADRTTVAQAQAELDTAQHAYDQAVDRANKAFELMQALLMGVLEAATCGEAAFEHGGSNCGIFPITSEEMLEQMARHAERMEAKYTHVALEGGTADVALQKAKASLADANDQLNGDKAADTAGDAAYHYTFAKYADSIAKDGLRPGTYATSDGSLSPLQAQLDLALPPNRGLPEVKIRVDVEGLRDAGYAIPDVTRVSSTVTGADNRVYTMPGGGYQMKFPYAIPGRFLKVER
jgi:RHS repeat-associated protein